MSEFDCHTFLFETFVIRYAH